ncbi:MAG: DUF928 domain-containing protein, partial [Symploca sp. SIO2B6]|nr:DUF928 domain-containing protein [Symploca sp. SIO2B6]
TEFALTDQLHSSGISTVDLSETDVQLEPNTFYRWQVVVVCDPNRPSESIVAEADILVVDPPTALTSTLAATPDPTRQVDIYGIEGFWYDAMGDAIALYEVGGKEAQLALLEDLAMIEAQEPQEAPSTDGDQEDISDDPDSSFSALLSQVVALLR